MKTYTDKILVIQDKDGLFYYNDGSGNGAPAKTPNLSQAADYSWGDPGSIHRNYCYTGDKLVEYSRTMSYTLIGEVDPLATRKKREQEGA